MSVASKNLYDLLGNDADSDDTPSGPVKTVDKTSTRTVKRNTDGEAPAAKGSLASTRSRGGLSGNEGAFRDRGAGSGANRLKTTDEPPHGGARGGRDARVRGGRGGRFPRDRDDRHNKSAPGGGSDKQAAQSWGAAEGEAEMKDEQAGEEIAKKDGKEASAENAAADAETPAEPEDKSISFEDYLAQQAEKKLALESESTLKVRQANEGSKQNKQWAAAKELVKDENDEFISGTGGKVKRERERKTKNLVDIDHQYVEPERTRGGGDRGRGGRGRAEGGRGRGDGFRGGPRGGGRGRGENLRGGDFRGGRGGSAPRGGQSNTGSLNPSDEKAFPSLGS